MPPARDFEMTDSRRLGDRDICPQVVLLRERSCRRRTILAREKTQGVEERVYELPFLVPNSPEDREVAAYEYEYEHSCLYQQSPARSVMRSSTSERPVRVLGALCASRFPCSRSQARSEQGQGGRWMEPEPPDRGQWAPVMSSLHSVRVRGIAAKTRTIGLACWAGRA